jgi:hypothetical protein
VGFVVGQSGAGQVFSEYFGLPAIVVCSTNYSTITLIYHPGKMYNRPMCGCSTGTYTNLGDLQRDLMGLSPTPPNKKKSVTTTTNTRQCVFYYYGESSSYLADNLAYGYPRFFQDFTLSIRSTYITALND